MIILGALVAIVVVLIILLLLIYRKLKLMNFLKKEQDPETQELRKQNFEQRIKDIEKKLG